MDSLTELRAIEPPPHRMVLGDSGITDAELTALALAADPDQPLADNALPISFYLAQLPNPLPDWYMPAATARHHRWWWPVVLVVVFAFVLVDAFGLCNTFGQLVVA